MANNTIRLPYTFERDGSLLFKAEHLTLFNIPAARIVRPSVLEK